MSKETTDTLGNQKKVNYALRADMTKEEFIKELLDGLGAPPPYFPQNVMLNISGYQSLDKIIERGSKPLSAQELRQYAAETEAIILDVRHEDDFCEAHIPGSIFIGLNGNFAPWVGALIMDVNQPLLLLTPEGKEQEAITRLARVGFDNTLGYLKGGISAWISAGYETDNIESISPEEFESAIANKHHTIIDSRKPGEFSSGHILDAVNIPLDNVNDRFNAIPDEHFYIHCAGGYRSVIMASILKARGIHDITNVKKGFAGIKNTNIPTTLNSAACS